MSRNRQRVHRYCENSDVSKCKRNSIISQQHY